MSGIFLLLLILLWLIIVLFITIWFVKRINALTWKWLVGVMLLMVLIPLPLIDEIMGKRQFEQLCQENSTIQFDRMAVIGRTVYLEESSDIQVGGNWLKTWKHSWRFLDVVTGEVIVSYNTFYVERYWLRMSESGRPFTFKGACEPGGVVDDIKLFRELGITQIQRSEIQLKGK